MVSQESCTSNEDRAISIAWEFVKAHKFDVVRLDSCQYFEDESPEWVVRFQLQLPEDVACGGELLLVTVDERSWRATVFETL